MQLRLVGGSLDGQVVERKVYLANFLEFPVWRTFDAGIARSVFDVERYALTISQGDGIFYQFVEKKPSEVIARIEPKKHLRITYD